MRYRLRNYPHAGEFLFHISSALVEGGFHEHGHDFIELTVIFDGTGRHTINGVVRDCRPGDAYVFHRGTVHAFSDAQKLMMMNVMFAPAFLNRLGRDVRALAGYQALFVLNARRERSYNCVLHLDPLSCRRIRGLLEAMAREFRKKTGGYQTVINGYLAQVIVEFSRLYDTTRSTAVGAVHSHAMAATAALIEHDLAQPHTIATLAAAAHMSRRSYFREFSKAYGETPIQYLLRKRLDHAAELLADLRLRVTDVAFDCGFSDSNYFSRQFVRRYGMSPRAFRKLTPLLA